PVDWWEWGHEAFAEARRRDVPLLISVGYAACHWCHVMAHESFEDPDVAELVNRHTVPVKVDREERPDVDAVYMTATQAMTGQGGWPMTVFATPDGEPFFCGTYFPRPNFMRLVISVSKAWRDQRDAVLGQGRAVVEALEKLRPAGASAPLSADVLDAAAEQLSAEHDQVNGGFGDAPKFPPSMCLEFLLRHHARTGSARSLEMARHTGERMARGGIYDQVGGGFARYSVDARWVVPHFEKMLYDNALLLRAYTHLWRTTSDPLARRVATQTAEFLVRDLATAEGGFASALDADTDGVEGATYVWTRQQLRDALGEADGDWAAELLEVTDEGTFEHGASVLQLPHDPQDDARWQRVRATLREVRDARPQPARDDKVVAAWNGLAITALAEYAAVIGDPLDAPVQAADAAVGAAELLARLHLRDGRLLRVSRAGRTGEAMGVLEDYGAVAEAWCAVHQLTADGGWLRRAGEVLDTAIERFSTPDGDPAGEAPGRTFHDTADDAEQLVARPADPTDNATPSGLTSVAMALTTYGALAGSTRHRDVARQALASVGSLAARHARFTGWACAVAEAHLAGPLEIAVVTPDPAGEPLAAAAWQGLSPGAVVVAGEPDGAGVPLLADRSYVDGAPAAYVCREFVCDRPVTQVAELRELISRHAAS
ncbi:MAG: thioredoxin domain-containing protein, partial [Micromonosporaceae bacterium]